MDVLFKLCAFALVTLVLAVFLQQHSPQTTALLAVAACVAILWVLAPYIRELLDFCGQLASRAGAEQLETLVRALREPYGRIAVLYFLQHKDTAEIAALVGRPPATVNSQLWRAKLLLRQQIQERRLLE